MAIYGDILSFFPELKKKYVYFRARPLTTGGYGTKPNDWKSYGNFYVYVLETVVNILDTQTSNPSVSVVNGRYA